MNSGRPFAPILIAAAIAMVGCSTFEGIVSANVEIALCQNLSADHVMPEGSGGERETGTGCSEIAIYPAKSNLDANPVHSLGHAILSNLEEGSPKFSYSQNVLHQPPFLALPADSLFRQSVLLLI